MLGVIKKQKQIFGKLEKLTEKIVYKNDHRLVSTNLAGEILKTSSKITQISYESGE